ncbi:MAG: sugar ABC transporter substrate-binding protein [Lachnospiraceae bacterium]|nr:sugar ABC transporter substrate-binding protein [Lachnospiraceae bacterium]
MFKRWICAILVAALALSLWYVAYTTDDPMYERASETDEATEEGEPGQQADSAQNIPAYTDDGSLTIWYTDDALTEYLSSVALSFQQDNDIKVNVVKKDGVQFLEAINADSVGNGVRTEAPCDLYITSHDNLLRAYLSGLASEITDPENVINISNYPQTALNAVTCYDHFVAYPLYYETNFFLYNKTYMASIAQNRIEADADLIEGEEATRQLEEEGAPKEVAKEISTDDGDDKEDGKEDDDKDEADGDKQSEEEGTDTEEGDMTEADLEDPMGNEDAVADPEVLEKLATMIPSTIEDIKTFANNYDAPEAVESVFKWDVSDIFYNYFFVGNYMDVGGEHGDNASAFNIYNSQAVECLRAYQTMNQFFSIDTKVDNYNNILQDFIDGKMVFTVATTDAIARIHDAQKNGEFDFEYGICALPDITDLLKARGLSVTDAVAVNGYSSKKDDANRLAEYIVYDKASDLYMKSGKVSCCKTVEYEDSEISNIMEEYEKSMPLPKMVETSNYWVQLEIAFTRVWNGQDPEEILKELSDTIGGQIEKIKANLPTQESFNAGGAGLIQ